MSEDNKKGSSPKRDGCVPRSAKRKPDFIIDLDEDVELELPVPGDPFAAEDGFDDGWEDKPPPRPARPENPSGGEKPPQEEPARRLDEELPPLSLPPKRSLREEDEELEPLKKPARDFHVNLDRELKKIPDYSPRQPSKKKKKKRGGLTVFAKVMLAIAILGVSVSLSVVILFAVQEVFGMNKEDSPAMVSVARDSGMSQIADQLEELGIIRSAELFKLYYKVTKPEGLFQYGTYKLNSNMSYDSIIEELFKYSTTRDEVKVMFPEGSTIYDMALALQKKGVCDVDAFLKTVDENDFGLAFEKSLPKNELRYHRLEGFAFPDTYNFFKDDNPVDVVSKALKNFESKWTPEMEEQRTATGMTLDQVITVASIVQKESGDPVEMKNVASVYLNRMRSKETFPKLEADPTRKYAEQLELQMGGLADQKIIDAYNTYSGAGLPPGPICNPGLDAIQAVLQPSETPYFFFCNNLETGEYFYAETMAQHEKNLVKAGLV